MNVASLELCKELYELSGWNEAEALRQEIHFDPNSLVNSAYTLPRYDLGYLMRELPEVTVVFRQRAGTSWRCHYNPEDSIATLGCEADTPEDAAAKLAIELFKQGILTPTKHKEAA